MPNESIAKLSRISRVSARLALVNETLRVQGKQSEADYWNGLFAELVYKYSNGHGNSMEFAESTRALERLYKSLDTIARESGNPKEG